MSKKNFNPDDSDDHGSKTTQEDPTSSSDKNAFNHLGDQINPANQINASDSVNQRDSSGPSNTVVHGSSSNEKNTVGPTHKNSSEISHLPWQDNTLADSSQPKVSKRIFSAYREHTESPSSSMEITTLSYQENTVSLSTHQVESLKFKDR